MCISTYLHAQMPIGSRGKKGKSFSGTAFAIVSFGLVCLDAAQSFR